MKAKTGFILAAEMEVSVNFAWSGDTAEAQSTADSFRNKVSTELEIVADSDKCAKIDIMLDQIHDEARAKFRSLAKATGQRTRVDRL